MAKSSCDGDDLGVHRIVGAQREKSCRTLHPGRTQRVFQPRVTHYERAVPTAAHFKERVRGVQFDDDYLMAGLSKMVAEQTADIAQSADDDMIPHQRYAELLKPIVEQQGEPAQRGVTGHDRREDASDLDCYG